MKKEEEELQYSILNFYIQRKIKCIFIEICELFHGNTSSFFSSSFFIARFSVRVAGAVAQD